MLFCRTRSRCCGVSDSIQRMSVMSTPSSAGATRWGSALATGWFRLMGGLAPLHQWIVLTGNQAGQTESPGCRWQGRASFHPLPAVLVPCGTDGAFRHRMAQGLRVKSISEISGIRSLLLREHLCQAPVAFDVLLDLKPVGGATRNRLGTLASSLHQPLVVSAMMWTSRCGKAMTIPASLKARSISALMAWQTRR